MIPYLVHAALLGELYGSSFILPTYAHHPILSFLLRLLCSGIAILKLMDIVWQSKSIGHTFLLGWIFGIVFWCVGLCGIYPAFLYVHQGLLFLPCLLFVAGGFGLLPGLACIGAKALAGKKKGAFALCFALFLVASSVLRSYFVCPFPWNLPAHIFSFEELYGLHCITQCVHWIGVHAFSLIWFGFLAAIFYGHLGYLSAFVVAIIALFAIGNIHINTVAQTPPKQQLSVLLLQPNIPQDLKLDASFHSSILSNTFELLAHARKEATGPIDLIIGPESAIPYLVRPNDPLFSTIQNLLQDGEYWILGADRLSNAPREWHNSLLVFSCNGLEHFYDKTRLLPFGEYIPLRGYLPEFFNRMLGGIDCAPGKAQSISLPAKRMSFWPIICSESIFPIHPEKNDALIIEILNNAWFASTIAKQHLAADRMRAIEAQKTLVRVSNTGITAVISPTGKIQLQLPAHQKAFQYVTVRLG